MRKLFTVVYASLITFALVAAPTANEDFVIEAAGNAYTFAVGAATAYTDIATNELHSAISGKAELNICEGAEFTTNDLWLCEWSGEVLPLRLTGPLVTWQKAYGTKPAVIYESYGGASRWRLSSDGYSDFLNVDGDATARILDFGDGLVVRRLTGGAHVVYSDELSRAVSGIAAPDYSTGNAELVATIEATAPAPGDYETVSNKAMTALQSYTETDPNVPSWAKVTTPPYLTSETDPTIKSWAKAATKPTYTLNEVAPNAENWLGVQGDAGRHIKVLAGTVGGQIVGGMRVTASTQNDNNMTTYTYGGVAVRRNGTNTDYLWDTTSSSGIVRRAELDDKADADDLSRLSNSVTSIAGMLNAENARFVSTNYNSAVHLPEAYVEAKIEGNWITIWSEMMRWNWLTGEYLPTNYYTKAQIDSALDGKVDRAWGFYDSHTGEYAPDGYAWVSAPKIAISGGLAYSRTVMSEGAVWVLESNGLVTETGGVVSNGFFRVSDDEGNSLFEIVKGDKRTVGAQAGSVRTVGAFTPTKLEIGYPVQAEAHPVLRIAATLANPTWYAEDDASCPANVSWSGTSGNYVVQVQAKSSSATQMFVKAEYEVGGETYIKNTAPISVTGGILCTDGVHKVRPVYNNGAITWEVVQ